MAYTWTTEVILNDVANNVIGITGGNGAGLDASIPTGEKAVYVKRVAKFPLPTSAGDIKTTRVTKAVGYAPRKEVAEIDLTSLSTTPGLANLTGKVLRLAADVKLSGAEFGEYSRWDVHKGQPFYVEYFVETTPATTAALATALATAFNKGLKKFDHVFLQVTASGSKLVITATDEYQRILPSTSLELIESAFDDVALVLAKSTVTTVGREGFGTTWFITKNLRLPTVEATRWLGELQDERPLVNTIYNQYVLQLEAKRNIPSHNAVGGLNVSITNHVFYVPQGTLATAFETVLTTAGFTITTVPGQA